MFCNKIKRINLIDLLVATHNFKWVKIVGSCGKLWVAVASSGLKLPISD